MKKLVCFVALMLGMSTATFATDENTEVMTTMEAYNLNASANGLVRFLNLNEDQKESVIETQRAFENAMRMAATMSDTDGRQKMVDNAIIYDLRNMSYILTENQFRKYRTVLNTTLRNRNIR